MTEINYVKLPASGGSPRETANVVNLLVDGKINAAGEVTLGASAASTTVTDYRVGSECYCFLPQQQQMRRLNKAAAQCSYQREQSRVLQ